MIDSHFTRLIRWSLFSFLVLGVLLGCRTLDLILGYPVPPASQMLAAARPTAAEEPIQEEQVSAATRVPLPTRIPTEPSVVQLPPTREPPSLLPTDLPPPPTEEIESAEEEPTEEPLAAAANAPQPTATDSAPAATPGPTRCPQQYCVVYRGCQPDAGNTMIEGFVYNNGVPENGVVLRVAKEPGAFPLVDDFVSGNSAINPGQPDPNAPGYYILQIVAGQPREGNWWVFVVDKQNGTKQLSEAQLIHTNDDPFNPVNCQHAFVDFVR